MAYYVPGTLLDKPHPRGAHRPNIWLEEKVFRVSGLSTTGSLEDGGSCEAAIGPQATFICCLNPPYRHLSDTAPHPCPHGVTCHGLPAGSLPLCPYSKLPEGQL